MERIEYRGIVDKSEWPRGEWDQEPDKIQWQDEATGLPCLIVRGPVGALCGYVGVPSGHPLHGKDYDNVSLEAHGGITFASGCAKVGDRAKWELWKQRLLARRGEAKTYPRGDAARYLKEWADGLESYEAWAERCEARSVCHRVPPGEPDDIWWFGFDCAHAGDFTPAYERSEKLGAPTGWGSFVEYRNLDYVSAECRELAKQLAAISAQSTE